MVLSWFKTSISAVLHVQQENITGVLKKDLYSLKQDTPPAHREAVVQYKE